LDVRGFLASPGHAPDADKLAPESPQPFWSAEIGEGTVGVPAIGLGVGALTTVDRWIYTFDTKTGEIFWRSRGDSPFLAGPVVDGKQIYTASQEWQGAVSAYDLHTGKRRWRQRVGDVSAPLVLTDSLLFGTTHVTGVTFALHTGDGSVAWRTHTTGSRGGLARVGDHLVLVTLTDSLMVLNAANGTIETRIDLGTSSLAPPAVVNDSSVAITSPDGEVILVTVPSGRVAWRVRTTTPIFGAPVVVGDTVFALTNDCTLWRIPFTVPNAATQREHDCLTVATPLVFRDGVLVATIRGELLMFDRANGELRWSRRIGTELRHAPVLIGEQLIVAPTQGPVVSYR
jgi:outer membrane protein assembly factor BamB